MTGTAIRVDAAELPVERWSDAARGGISWRMLFSADRTATGAVVCGLATLEAGEELALHRHTQPEIYFGICGNARVNVSGETHALGPGVALFIPGDAPHAVTADEPAEFFYAFAGDSFEEVTYVFLEEGGDDA